jgi:hypothetical protein
MASPLGGGRVGGSGLRLAIAPGGGGSDRVGIVSAPGIVGTGGNVLRGGGTGREDLRGTDGGGSIPAWRSGGAEGMGGRLPDATGGLDVRSSSGAMDGAIDGNGQSVDASERKGFCAGLTLAGGGGGGANEMLFGGEGSSDGGLGGSVFGFGGGTCAGGGRGENAGDEPAEGPTESSGGDSAFGGKARGPSDPRRDRGGGGGGGTGESVPRRGGSGGACEGRAALTALSGRRPSKTSRFDSSSLPIVVITPTWLRSGAPPRHGQ